MPFFEHRANWQVIGLRVNAKKTSQLLIVHFGINIVKAGANYTRRLDDSDFTSDQATSCKNDGRLSLGFCP
jgi:hypothetical protein